MLISKGYEYRAEYDGCNGWTQWLRDVIVVTAYNYDELATKKKQAEEDSKKKSGTYDRVSIDKWTEAEEIE
jgi:hypothetical protein